MAISLVPILIIGAGLLLLSRGGGKGGGLPLTTPEEKALLEKQPGGFFRYNDKGFLLGAFSLQGKSVLPTQDPQVFGLKQWFTLQEVPPSFVGATQVANAYEGAKDLHARGFDVWVTPTLLPSKEQTFAERHMAAVSPGQKPPDLPVPLALYRRASEPWLEEQVSSAPPAPAFPPPPPPVS